MNGKYPMTCIGILDADTQKWYEAEQCWNCEPIDLRKMRIRKSNTKKKWF